MKNLFLATVALSLLFTVGCSAPDAAPKNGGWQTMTLIGAKPTFVDINDTDDAREHGESMAFETRLSDESGKAVGQHLGLHVIVDIPGDDGVGHPEIEERFVTTAFVFDDGDEIMAQGALVFPVNERLKVINAPQYRAIVGGTGKYRGIRGQVKIIRNSDDTYTHVLEYKVD